MTNIENVTENLDTFSSLDKVEAGEVASAVLESIEKYSEFWKNYDGIASEVNLEQHASILKVISEINQSVCNISQYQELVSEDHAEDFIREHIENEFPELIEYSEYGYEWPSNYVEFNIDEAIQEKITEAEPVILSGTTFYIIEI
jgi:hypothetical protein